MQKLQDKLSSSGLQIHDLSGSSVMRIPQVPSLIGRAELKPAANN